MTSKDRVCDWARKKEGGAKSFRKRGPGTDREKDRERWRKRINLIHVA